MVPFKKETPLYALGRTGRTEGYQLVHVIIHLAETADSQTEDRAILKQALLDRALCANRCAAPFLICLTSFPDVLALDSPPAKVGRVARIPDAYFGLVSKAGPRACLLYTSPSPRDAHESRMPSSA